MRGMLNGVVAQRVDPERVRLRQPSAAAESARAAFFRTVVERDLERSYRLATVILGNEADAEDAVHDAAEKAWRRWGELRDEGQAEQWFRRILVNVCRDRLRQRQRRPLLSSLRNLVEREAPVVDDAGAGLAQRDQLSRAFERLSPDQRIVVALRYEQDLTVPALARLLGIAEGTVKSRLHHALRRLRAAIEETDR